MTPSTWIGGISNAFGYTTPGWILNTADGLATYYFMNKAKDRIKEEGLNFSTGLDALMSLAPFTRDGEAINAVGNALRNPTQALRSVVDDFRMARNAVKNSNVGSAASNLANNLRTALSSNAANVAREFNNSVKSTRLVNVPIEHVSPNGITKGSALEVGQEGIHLSPYGSSTTPQIQQFFISQGQYPHVRTGTWTYSNNTQPMQVNDVGGFWKGINPEFDAMVDKGIINFKYANNFEGKGNTSYLTTEPSFGLQLSRNITNPQRRVTTFQKGIIPPDILANNAGIRITTKPELTNQSQLQGYTQFGSDYSQLGTGGTELQQAAVDRFINPYVEELMDFYKSGFYAKRLAKAGLLNERDKILAQKQLNLNNTRFGVNTKENMENTYAWTGWDDELNSPYGVLEYNIDDDYVPIRFATLHEGSHSSSLNLPEITKHNKSLLTNIWDNVKPELRNNPQVQQYVEYVSRITNTTNPNAAVSEFGGQLQNAFRHMQKNNLTVDQLLQDTNYISTDPELRNAITTFKPEFVKKLLMPGGIISSILLPIYDNANNQ